MARLFGPIMLRLVFCASRRLERWRSSTSLPGASGAQSRLRRPIFRRPPASGILFLGAVVLAITGGEALYADLGHFGKRPIRLAWFGFVLPALLLNYFGQGALLLRDPGAPKTRFICWRLLGRSIRW